MKYNIVLLISCVFWCWRYFSQRIRRLKICSAVLLPALKPACTSAMIFSACGFNLFSMIFSMTLLGRLMRLIVRQFWHCCRLPFLGSVMTKDWVYVDQFCWDVVDSSRLPFLHISHLTSTTLFLQHNYFKHTHTLQMTHIATKNTNFLYHSQNNPHRIYFKIPYTL